MDYLLPVSMIVIGCIAIWVFFGSALREYWAAGDDYGATVTIVAMAGAFLPFVGGALITLPNSFFG